MSDLLLTSFARRQRWRIMDCGEKRKKGGIEVDAKIFFSRIRQAAARRMGGILTRGELPKNWAERVRRLLAFVEACEQAEKAFAGVEYDFGEIAREVFSQEVAVVPEEEEIPSGVRLTPVERYIVVARLEGDTRDRQELLKEACRQAEVPYKPKTMGAVIGTFLRKLKRHGEQIFVADLTPQQIGQLVALTGLEAKRLREMILHGFPPPAPSVTMKGSGSGSAVDSVVGADRCPPDCGYRANRVGCPSVVSDRCPYA